MKEQMVHPADRNLYSLEHALQLRKSAPDQIGARQKGFLKAHLKHASNSPFYRERFGGATLDIEEIACTMDMSSIPLTSREDIECDIDAFLVPEERRSDIIDISLTSGTSGKALSVPFTRRDVERLGFNEAVAFYGAGIRRGDTVLLQVTIDRCFIAGLAYFQGCKALGAAAVRSGPGGPAAQWQLIKDLKPSAIVGVPAHIAAVGKWGREHGDDVAGSSVRNIVAIGEPVRKPDLQPLPLGEEIAGLWKCSLSSTYAATELQTCFCECEHGCGGHIHPELSIVEIVDENGDVLPPGMPGEVVVTPLGVEGMPLVRYRTGDVARLFSDPCACGWNTPRLGPVEARLCQRLKYRGTTIYPEMIFQTLQKIPQVRAAYVEVREDFDLSDHVTVVVGEAGDEKVDIDDLDSLLQAHLRVRPAVRVEPYEKVLKKMTEDGGRKPKKFFDYR